MSKTDQFIDDLILNTVTHTFVADRDGLYVQRDVPITQDQAMILAQSFFQSANSYNSREAFYNDIRFNGPDAVIADNIYNTADYILASLGLHDDPNVLNAFGYNEGNDTFDNPEDFGFGGIFHGNQIIKEKQGKYIFTPSSYYCGLKVIAKIFNLQNYSTKGYADYTCDFKKLAEFWFDNVFKKSNPTHPGFQPKTLLARFFEAMPDIYICVLGKKDFKMILFNNFIKRARTPNRIILMKYHNGIGHLVYGENIPEDYTSIRYELFQDMQIELQEDMNITSTADDWFMLREYQPKSVKVDDIIVFDMEAHTVDYEYVPYNNVIHSSDDIVIIDDKQFIKRKLAVAELYPYSVQWQWVKLSDKNFPSLVTVDEVKGPNKQDSINLLIKFLDDLVFYMDRQDPIVDEIQIYAHYGGAFDFIFFKAVPVIKFLEEIKVGNKLKHAIFSYKNKKFILKDSYPFINMSLKKAGKQLQIDKKYQKKDFDIKSMTFDDYINPINKDWKEYAEYDIHALREIIYKLEEMYSVFGESITNKLGVPGIAWNISHKACDVMRRGMYYPKSQLLIKFIKSAMYGGRVFVFKRYMKNVLGIDFNSLYPSVMMNCEYPVGIPHTIDPATFDPRTNSLYIIHCTLVAPNVAHAIHPHRTNTGRVIYPSNQYFTGSYSSVEIKEMLLDGYIIKDIYYGIEWNQKAKIFEQIISALYEIRKQYKLDGNAIEQLIKLILNSFYGKFLESIDTKHAFVMTDDIKKYIIEQDLKGKKVVSGFEKLVNDQFEIRYNLETSEIRKPIQIGVFVLSYARALVNKAIRIIGTEHIGYSDTDSLYLTKARYDELQSNPEFTKMIGNNLCQFKNDYGEGVLINEAIFLDQKRYFLKFITDSCKPNCEYCELRNYFHEDDNVICKGRNTCKSKFNGMTFEKPDKQYNTNIDDCQCPEQTEIIEDMYKELAENYDTYKEDESSEIKTVKKLVNRLVKKNISVFASTTELQFSIGPDKKAVYDKESGEYYAIGYDKEQTKPYRTHDEYLEWYVLHGQKYDEMYLCDDRLHITSDEVPNILSDSHARVMTVYEDKTNKHTLISMVRIPQFHKWLLINRDFNKQGKIKYVTKFVVFPDPDGNFTMNPETNTKCHIAKVIDFDNGYLVSPSGLTSGKKVVIPKEAKYIIAKKGKDKNEFKYEMLNGLDLQMIKNMSTTDNS